MLILSDHTWTDFFITPGNELVLRMKGWVIVDVKDVKAGGKQVLADARYAWASASRYFFESMAA